MVIAVGARFPNEGEGVAIAIARCGTIGFFTQIIKKFFANVDVGYRFYSAGPDMLYG